MNFLLTVIITTFCTFLVAYISSNKYHNVPKVGPYYTHHSIVGLIISVIGLCIIAHVGLLVVAIGIGIFLAHGIEEIYYSRTTYLTAFFIFFSKQKSSNYITRHT